MVNTPVLFETFARPDYARKAFDAIKKAQPQTLYFYSNKARADRPDEVKRNEEIRAYIKEIDWDCNLHTFFRDEYVDVFTSLWGSLDWFFNSVDEGIVLEEDCVASLAFFDYCEKLLPLYKKEKKIRLISGDNFTPEFSPQDYNYFFSRYMHIYGWASWSDRWKSMDRDMLAWNEVKKKKIRQYFSRLLPSLYYRFILGKTYKKPQNTKSWDCVTQYDMICNNEYAIVPAFNLVDDIGSLGANAEVDAGLRVLEEYKDETYPTDKYPNIISSIDAYDYRHFKKHILKGFLSYQVRKQWHKFFNRIKVNAKTTSNKCNC